MNIKHVAFPAVIIACTQALPVRLLSAQQNTTMNSAPVIYVSPHGDDTADGSEAAPLATITAAQKRIREMKASGSLPQGGVVVEMLHWN